MEPLRMGVLGCAGIARRRMLPAINAFPDTRLVAVASRDPLRARRTAADAGCEAVHGYAELLARDDIDAVYVPLPAALHEQWVRAALEAGKHVLGEKPLTTDPAATAELAALAATSGLALRENVMFVHHAQHAEVRRLVEDGAIGEIRFLRAEFAIPRLPDGDIRYDPRLGGGALWDTGVYPVRAALYFLGADLELLGASRTGGAPGRPVDVSGTALLRTPSGTGVHLAFGLDHAYRSAYEIWGSEGVLTVDRAFTPPAEMPPRVRLERKDEVRDLVLPADDQVRNTLAAFTEAARGGTALEPVVLDQAVLLDRIHTGASPRALPTDEE
ncbi:Gfo/Idh/MocA family oxidoreductase [Actinocorallia sp. API 0066]|uniref:Gfo/Idh/MocA family protein n=1 Tax=Actinocorallia sp. API 0066 TaxID=2896846 RepID=UPI001E2EE8A3|nr:Gfo/Idh/MocA family oxidoreductase [Actinocorallia sp. API 0066]MCD0452121.1 Gfo/Idh/MocA family oxidoreductase [Actinocorallia sp. API 0066]